MDDQNQNNQPIDPGVVTSLPNVPEDITPVETTTPVAPITSTTTTTTTEPAAISEPVLPPIETPAPTPTPTPEPSFVPPQPEPITTTTTTTATEPIDVPPLATADIATPMATTTTTTTEVSQPKAEEVQMPTGKPKKKVMPAILGVLALFLVVGVAGAAYYVSNQLSTRQAVAPNAPTSKPAAAINCATGTFSCGSFCCANNTQSCGSTSCVPRVSGTATPSPSTGGGGVNCPTNQFSCGSWCCRNDCDSCGPGINEQCVPRTGRPTSCDTIPTLTPTPTDSATIGGCAAGCYHYPDEATPNENCTVCSPDRSKLSTVTFATAGTVRIHFENVAAGTTVTLTKDGANATMTKVDDNNFDAAITAGTYTIAVKLGNETANSVGFIAPDSNNKCGRYDPSNKRDIAPYLTTAALTTEGISTTTGVDIPGQCWADAIQGTDDDSRGQLDANYDFNDFNVIIGYKATISPTASPTISPTVGACNIIYIYKKVNEVYGTTPLTATDLQALQVGDVLELAMNTNKNNLQGQFRITVNGTAGDWIWGDAQTTGTWTTIVHRDYTVATVGTYTFEGQVTTTP